MAWLEQMQQYSICLAFEHIQYLSGTETCHSWSGCNGICLLCGDIYQAQEHVIVYVINFE